jgi:hypothetical protein
MTIVSQAEFARQQGWARSYVTALKQQGRLVMTADGRVDTDASRQRIADTADPNRDDVAARHAAERDATPPQKPAEDDKIGNSYAAARAVKEGYAARTAKLEYERAIGKMIEKEAVAAIVEDVITDLRQSLEQQPHRIAATLIGQDLDGIRRTLKTENAAILRALVKSYNEQLQQLIGI